MNSFEQLVTQHPYFSMLVFTCIGFLIHGMKRLNIALVRTYLDDLQLALDERDLEQAKDILQKLKKGFGCKS